MKRLISITNPFRTAALILSIAVVLRGGDSDILALLKRQIAARPGDTQLRVQLAETLVDQERFAEARDAIRAALMANAQNSDLHRVNGDLLLREGQIPEADAEYAAATKLDGKNVLALSGRARTLQAAGFRAQAAELIRTAHALAPASDQIGEEFAALNKNPASESHVWELASPYLHYELPYRVLREGKRSFGAGLTISINGVKTSLRLDTGADGVTVSSRFAAKAGIQRIGDSQRWGIGSNGAVNTWIGHAGELRIGDVEFKNVIIEVAEKGSIDESGGLLGASIFKRFLVKVDFVNHRLDLDPLFGPPWDGYSPVDRYAGPETKAFAQIFQLRHYLLIPAVAGAKAAGGKDATLHAAGLFMIDTGAGFNSISPALARSITTVRDNHRMSIRGVSGKVKTVYQADHVVLQFAKFQSGSVDFAAFDLSGISRSAGSEISGILGMPLLSTFRSFTIDYRDAGIRFDYNPP